MPMKNKDLIKQENFKIIQKLSDPVGWQYGRSPAAKEDGTD